MHNPRNAAPSPIARVRHTRRTWRPAGVFVTASSSNQSTIGRTRKTVKWTGKRSSAGSRQTRRLSHNQSVRSNHRSSRPSRGGYYSSSGHPYTGARWVRGLFAGSLDGRLRSQRIERLQHVRFCVALFPWEHWTCRQRMREGVVAQGRCGLRMPGGPSASGGVSVVRLTPPASSRGGDGPAAVRQRF